MELNQRRPQQIIRGVQPSQQYIGNLTPPMNNQNGQPTTITFSNGTPIRHSQQPILIRDDLQQQRIISRNGSPQLQQMQIVPHSYELQQQLRHSQQQQIALTTLSTHQQVSQPATLNAVPILAQPVATSTGSQGWMLHVTLPNDLQQQQQHVLHLPQQHPAGSVVVLQQRQQILHQQPQQISIIPQPNHSYIQRNSTFLPTIAQQNPVTSTPTTEILHLNGENLSHPQIISLNELRTPSTANNSSIGLMEMDGDYRQNTINNRSTTTRYVNPMGRNSASSTGSVKSITSLATTNLNTNDEGKLFCKNKSASISQ